MSSERNLLTFELSEDGQELDVHADSAGIAMLMKVLSGLQSATGHEHLMSPSWGGAELSENAQGVHTQLLNKVTIHRW